MIRPRKTNTTAQASPFKGSTLYAMGQGKPSNSYGRIFTGLLFALVLFFLFFMLFFSVTTYQAVNTARSTNDENRLALSLLSNSVRMNDTTNAVGVGEGPEGAALVLTEKSADQAYETRLYSYEGFIVEEYALAGSPYTPDRAREVVSSDLFDFSYNDGLLSIRTDQGSASVSLRSAKRGA